ncbi:hypothetical protein DL96DRAFT_1816663 [Flagelloscypha sp. PMI_526]|nr:hypothetical protein DL96DRAFT_1816663 [Flagelloscypha sp. PMI_526]
MGVFEVFDLITGVSASGGPDAFIYHAEEREELAEDLSEKILAASTSTDIPGKEELQQILSSVLFFTSDEAGEEKVPFPGTWQNPAIVVSKSGGDSDGEDEIKIQYCFDYDLYGEFNRTLGADKPTALYNSDSPFMDSRCWHYLRSWIFRPGDSELSLDREMYDAFTNDVDGPAFGLSENLNYGLMLHMHGQTQDYFLENCSIPEALEHLCLDGAPNLSAAILNGIRGKALVPALFCDFQVWIFESPDIWPHKADSRNPKTTFRTFDAAAGTAPQFLALSLELLLQILSSLSLVDLVNLSSTSTSMRQAMTQPQTFQVLLRDMVLSPKGDLRWIQPCALVEGEVESANEALRTWIPQESEEPLGPLHAQDFPFVEFVRTCLVGSGSMKNRKRIWRMIKQVEVVLDTRKANNDVLGMEADGNNSSNGE